MAEKVRSDRKALTGKNHKAARQKLGLSSFPISALKAAEPLSGFVSAASDFDQDVWLLGVPGGYIDLRTGKICSPDPALMLSKRTLVAPEEGTPVAWEKFLKEACGDDMDYVAYLQRLCGLFLTGDTTAEQFWFMHGFGRNGKGVFLKTIRRILHNYALEAPVGTFIEQKNPDHLTEIARLMGARLVLASEVPEKAVWNTQRLKELTGNELKIAARFMRQDFVEFEFVGKILIVGNAKPQLRNVDEAIRRRLQLLPFESTPKHVDLKLKEKLEVEDPQILNWMLEGLREYQKIGTSAPQVVVDASAQYLSDEDKFMKFWLSRHEKEEKASVKVADIVTQYASWSASNHSQALATSSRGMKQLLTSRGFTVTKQTPGLVVVGWKPKIGT